MTDVEAESRRLLAEARGHQLAEAREQSGPAPRWRLTTGPGN
ncbi:hypothetical protein OIE73_17640 [Streptomyces hirsutus]|uniref:Uncharacterized protein n=1 Tax=Streptomyces hirsutus TaxID=35620 RepID=A0ABZ1GQA4_9ACTN|nr:hypothetical protein [Streptomyces hirsutus]WSD07405.1 hypothetical protein OIE73_17640 [Streptomyces hirsutus]